MSNTKEGVSVDRLVRVYRKIRDAKAALSAKFNEEEAALNAQMDAVKASLLDYLQEHGLDSAKTRHGLVYRSVQTRYWTGDWEAMHQFILEHECPDLLEKWLNQSAVKAFMEDNPGVVPPGLNADSKYTITVRKA